MPLWLLWWDLVVSLHVLQTKSINGKSALISSTLRLLVTFCLKRWFHYLCREKSLKKFQREKNFNLFNLHSQSSQNHTHDSLFYQLYYPTLKSNFNLIQISPLIVLHTKQYLFPHHSSTSFCLPTVPFTLSI